MNSTSNSQAKTPLLDALRDCANKPHAAFYTPGHKRGMGTPRALVELLGAAVFRADLPELAQLDNLFAPEGVIQEAQELAAAAFGADRTWFLINGSTAGIIAAILATCGTGDKIILPRNVHSSAIAALILSGAIPIFVNPEYDPILDIAHSIAPAAVAAALERHPDAKAVMMVYPTYYGVGGDVRAIAQIAHQYNIPLLVDEAHGPHFAFHPDLPVAALSAGADLTVQSTHKVLSAFTQASMLHVRGDAIDATRVSKALQLVQSTSPNYLLLASLDAARQQMALHGKRLMGQTLELADEARTRIGQIPGLSVLETLPSPGFLALDRSRLTVTVSGLGLTGFKADEILERSGITAEFPSLKNLTFIISLGNTKTDIEALVQAFATLAKEYRLEANNFYSPIPLYPCSPAPLALSPREAFFAATETLPILESCGRICAEIICPYPPGIPILMPGEIITEVALDYLQKIRAMGGFITGATEPTLQAIEVIQSYSRSKGYIII